MGNTENPHQVNTGITQFIAEEFDRLKLETKRNYLVLSELLQARHPEDFPFTFRHLGILYICDKTKDGVFTIEDFHYFVIWIQINMPAIQMYEFEAQLQSRTVAKMIEDIENKQSEIAMTKWFVVMLMNNYRTKTIKGETYILIDAIKTLYQVLNVALMSDMDIQSFFFLVKRSSQEMGHNIEEVYENEEEEQYIIVKVCEEFIACFLRGVLKILKNIGYSTSSLEIK